MFEGDAMNKLYFLSLAIYLIIIPGTYIIARSMDAERDKKYELQMLFWLIVLIGLLLAIREY